MSKHTKGPWRIVVDRPLETAEVFGPEYAITKIPLWENRDRKLANARLIAAAPCLLDALTKLTEAAEKIKAAGGPEIIDFAAAIGDARKLLGQVKKEVWTVRWNKASKLMKIDPCVIGMLDHGESFRWNPISTEWEWWDSAALKWRFFKSPPSCPISWLYGNWAIMLGDGVTLAPEKDQQFKEVMGQ